MNGVHIWLFSLKWYDSIELKIARQFQIEYQYMMIFCKFCLKYWKYGRIGWEMAKTDEMKWTTIHDGTFDLNCETPHWAYEFFSLLEIVLVTKQCVSMYYHLYNVTHTTLIIFIVIRGVNCFSLSMYICESFYPSAILVIIIFSHRIWANIWYLHQRWSLRIPWFCILVT